MKPIIPWIFTVLAIVLLVFAFIAGWYPHHDLVRSTFFVAWALAVAWLGSVVSSRIP